MDAEEDGYTICLVQLGTEPPDDQSNTDGPILDPNVNAWMDEGFYLGMVQAADRADAHFGPCFNCLKDCHRWRECKKTPLLPELQDILDREALNKQGGCQRQMRPHPHESQEWQGEDRYASQSCPVKSKSDKTPLCYWD